MLVNAQVTQAALAQQRSVPSTLPSQEAARERRPTGLGCVGAEAQLQGPLALGTQGGTRAPVTAAPHLHHRRLLLRRQGQLPLAPLIRRGLEDVLRVGKIRATPQRRHR